MIGRARGQIKGEQSEKVEEFSSETEQKSERQRDRTSKSKRNSEPERRREPLISPKRPGINSPVVSVTTMKEIKRKNGENLEVGGEKTMHTNKLVITKKKKKNTQLSSSPHPLTLFT